jgi:hypothetical protein
VCWYDIRDRESESNFSGGADASLKRTIMECRLSSNEENEMTIASDLLQQHIQTLVDDNARWQTLIADDYLRLSLAEESPTNLNVRRRRATHVSVVDALGPVD